MSIDTACEEYREDMHGTCCSHSEKEAEREKRESRLAKSLEARSDASTWPIHEIPMHQTAQLQTRIRSRSVQTMILGEVAGLIFPPLDTMLECPDISQLFRQLSVDTLHDQLA